VGNLEEYAGWKPVHGMGDHVQALDHPFLMDADLARAGFPGWVHIGVPGDDEADFAFREPGKERYLPLCNRPVIVGHKIMGCRANEAIGYKDTTDLDWIKEY
jgi:hypothetical protein